MTKANKLKAADRQRNTLGVAFSDRELETLKQIIAESEHTSRAEWIRAAIEAYAGKKIFRERQEHKK